MELLIGVILSHIHTHRKKNKEEDEISIISSCKSWLQHENESAHNTMRIKQRLCNCVQLLHHVFPSLSFSLHAASKASSRRHRRHHHDSRHRSHRHRHYRQHVPGGASASEFTASELDTATEVTTDADTTSYCDTEDTLR